MSAIRWLFALFFAFAGLAQDLPKGRVVDRVECGTGAGQTYALYLPSAYDPARAWPILYCFDPGARGRLAVERFRDAAEKYGYIAAGSNNSRNGPMAPILAAMQAVWDDTQSRFHADAKRIYAAGFSGGARVSLRLGLSVPLAGVIACGAAFPPPGVPKSIPFAFYGIAGTEDFNMPEFRQADRALDRMGAPHRVRQFEGGHGWPPVALCTEAIEWMELHGLKSGLRPPDAALLDSLFEIAAARLRRAESAGDVYQAWVEAAAIASDFEGVKDVSSVRQQAEKWRKSDQVKAALKLEDKVERRQEEISNELERLNQGLADMLERPQNLSALKSLMADLGERRNAAADSPERRAARRALLGFQIRLRDECRDLMANRQYALATPKLEVAAASDPERAGAHFDLAVAYAQTGQKRKATAELVKAVEKGMRNTELFAADPLLAPLRDEPEFKRLIIAANERE